MVNGIRSRNEVQKKYFVTAPKKQAVRKSIR
jgi:hypothetical protein